MSTLKIAATTDMLKANTAVHVLNEAGIECFLVNKKDSAYAISLGGTIELHVHESKASEALNILEERAVLADESE